MGQAAALRPSYLVSRHPAVITFLFSWKFLTITGYVTFLATLEIGDLAYGSRSASHNRVYSSLPFASRVTLVTRVTRFSAITTLIRGHFFGPVSLLHAIVFFH
jgi:hypothetical protein